MNYCNVNWESNYARINDRCIKVSDYTDDLKGLIKCGNGHDLIFVTGVVIRSHFRHKHNADVGGVPLTAWHAEWQGNFEETEVLFPKIENASICNRRADVVVNGTIIEFQHSLINRVQVNARLADYKLHNREIIWVLDGNNRVEVITWPYDRQILKFSKSWLYVNFDSYDYVFVDIGEKIYKIYPKYVRGGMLDVERPYDKCDFINMLTNNINLLMTFCVPKQSTLYIRQQGAGNGKTYGIVQTLTSEDFRHYNTFIMITKQHSAKYIIYQEFYNQEKAGKLRNIRSDPPNDNNKKYTISYTDIRDNVKKTLIIATIDSLMWNIGGPTKSSVNPFIEKVNNIINGAADKTESIKYADVTTPLNKQLCLICDETQDLAAKYGEALFQLMLGRYIDLYVVGDRLQSVSFENNAFNYLQDSNFPNINKKCFRKSNICRRFKSQRLANFVNNVINFAEYDLPTITLAEVSDNNNQDPLTVALAEVSDNNNNYDPLTIFNIYGSKNGSKCVNEDSEKIMTFYRNEVALGRKPEDFLIVTPFVQSNPLCVKLEQDINSFWSKRNKETEFIKYAYFHKSQEGTSIDLKDSEMATRIVSIHSSKGDGRNVVFVIGLTESSLKKFANNNKNSLVYESLLHVAITRMIEKLYISIEGVDDIYRRFENYIRDKIIERPIIQKLWIKDLSNEDTFLKFKEHFGDSYFEIEKNENERIIDMKHHNIRWYIMQIQFWIEMYKEYKNIGRKQILAIFNKLINRKIYPRTKDEKKQDGDDGEDDKELNNKEYIKAIKKCSRDELEPIPFVRYYNDNNININEYYKFIISCARVVLMKLKRILEDRIEEFCPYESIILYYMVSIHFHGQYCEISMQDLFIITDIYNNAFKFTANINNNKPITIAGHKGCTCIEIQTLHKSNNPDDKVKDLKEYINKHYEIIDNYKLKLREFKLEHPNLNYLIEYKHSIGDILKINTTINAVAYNDTEVFIIIFTPQLTNLNAGGLFIKCIIQLFMFKITDSIRCDKYEKFKGKHITSVIFTTTEIHYVSVDNAVIKNSQLIRDVIYDFMLNKLINSVTGLYKYLNFSSKNNRYSVWDLYLIYFQTGKRDPTTDEFMRIVFRSIIQKNITYILEFPKDDFDIMILSIINLMVREFINNFCNPQRIEELLEDL